MKARLAARLARTAYPGISPAPDDGWIIRARCRKADVDKDLFFSREPSDQRAAQSVCATCPVIVNCLAYSLATTYKVPGVWGGTTVEQRGRLVGQALRNRCRECGAELPGESASPRYCPACSAARSSDRHQNAWHQ